MQPEEIISVLGDEYSPRILAAAADPMSAQELSNELGVPLATCYRRIDDLTEVDLLELTDRVLSDQGGRTAVYRRRTDEVRIRFDETDLSVHVEERGSVKRKLDDVWRSTGQT